MGVAKRCHERSCYNNLHFCPCLLLCLLFLFLPYFLVFYVHRRSDRLLCLLQRGRLAGALGIKPFSLAVSLISLIYLLLVGLKVSPPLLGSLGSVNGKSNLFCCASSPGVCCLRPSGL
ncbi:hypothetical protein IWX90DRAFT_35442 [Phyllosticta citrichinensis]|uniref:Uncharacterized protein n=1 Tax=Phyllosticta citrichinensis TaxID=1130410 RepID=A0ABR1Y7X1_9PEZI